MVLSVGSTRRGRQKGKSGSEASTAKARTAPSQDGRLPPPPRGRAQGRRPQLNSNPLPYDRRPVVGQKLPGEGRGRGRGTFVLGWVSAERLRCRFLREARVGFLRGGGGVPLAAALRAVSACQAAGRWLSAGGGRDVAALRSPVIQPCLWVLWQTGVNRWRGASFSLLLSRRESAGS